MKITIVNWQNESSDRGTIVFKGEVSEGQLHNYFAITFPEDYHGDALYEDYDLWSEEDDGDGRLIWWSSFTLESHELEVPLEPVPETFWRKSI